MNFNIISQFLNTFFFEERTTYNLSVFRIVWSLFLFLNLLFEFGNVSDFYGPDAIVSLEVVQNQFKSFQFNLFNYLENSLENAYFIYFLTLISVFMTMLGLGTRFFLILSLVGFVSLHMRNVWLLSSADVLIRCVGFILIWSPCNRVLSLDSLIAKRINRPMGEIAPIWTWRLLQIQLSVIYLWTFWAKIKGDDWFNGEAVYYATRLDSMKNLTLPWLLDNRVILALATWGTLVVEFGLGTLVWFKGFRLPFIIAGLGLHLGIELAMAIPFFEWFMIIMFINYFSPEEVKSMVFNLKLKIHSKFPVILGEKA